MILGLHCAAQSRGARLCRVPRSRCVSLKGSADTTRQRTSRVAPRCSVSPARSQGTAGDTGPSVAHRCRLHTAGPQRHPLGTWPQPRGPSCSPGPASPRQQGLCFPLQRPSARFQGLARAEHQGLGLGLAAGWDSGFPEALGIEPLRLCAAFSAVERGYLLVMSEPAVIKRCI